MRNRRAGLSRRVRRQYLDIINGDDSGWYPPWGWKNFKSNSSTTAGNSWSAFFFAKQWRGRAGIDMIKLYSIVCRSENPEVAYRWAREIPVGNVRRLQKLVASFGSVELIRAFAQNVPGADRTFLEGLCIVKEVLGL